MAENKRFIAYAKATGKTPDEARAEKQCNYNYMRWFYQKKRDFEKVSPNSFKKLSYSSQPELKDWDAFDEFIGADR